MSCHVMSCHVMSCHVMSCHVMSCHVMSCHVMSCHVMTRHVTSCHFMSCHVMSTLTWLVTSCPVMSCRVMSGNSFMWWCTMLIHGIFYQDFTWDDNTDWDEIQAVDHCASSVRSANQLTSSCTDFETSGGGFPPSDPYNPFRESAFGCEEDIQVFFILKLSLTVSHVR